MARLWDARTGAELARLAHDGPVSSATFSPEGARVLTTSDDNMARLWEASTGVEVGRFAHRYWVLSAAFSPDGAYAMTASHDNVVRLWDVGNGTEIARFGHDGPIVSAAFSADGTRIVTASENLARLWDVASGLELTRFVHDGPVSSAAFSPDSLLLLTASGETGRLWDITMAAGLIGDRLLRALSRTNLIGKGRLTDGEFFLLQPILGEVDRDVVSRWTNPASDDSEIEMILSKWRRQRQKALTLTTQEWTKRGALIRKGPLTSRRVVAPAGRAAPSLEESDAVGGSPTPSRAHPERMDHTRLGIVSRLFRRKT